MREFKSVVKNISWLLLAPGKKKASCVSSSVSLGYESYASGKE